MCTTTMVAAFRTNLNPKTPSQGGGGERTRLQNPTRPPLVQSDTDNALAPPRRSKSRDVASRYMSFSSTPSGSSNSRRCPSPLVSRTPAANKITSTPTPKSAVKRAQSAERRRPVTPHPNALDSRHYGGGVVGGEVSSAPKTVFKSTRSLLVSFQGESFSFQVSKEKPAPSSPAFSLNCRSERRKTAVATLSENSKPIEQHRWPVRLNQHQPCDAKSFSFDDERGSGGGGSGGNVVMRVVTSAAGNAGECGVNSTVIGSEYTSDVSESVSRGSTNSVLNDVVGGLGQQALPGFVVSRTPMEARSFPTNSKLFIPLSSPKEVVNSRGQASPVRGTYWRASASPSRLRSLVPNTPSNNYSCNTPSILSFAADVRRGKVAESRIFDAHVLRLLYNRLLQWRLVNARVDVSLSAQNLNAERSLYNGWVSTAKLRESVKAKRTELQFMRQTLKLIFILKGQMKYLEEWSLLDQAYTGALSGAIESLRASTLRLPVIGGARAQIQDIKDAICSAVDVFQAMASPLSLLSPKVEEVNYSMSELSNLTSKERALLDHCKLRLSTAVALQVKECSVRTQVVQLTRTRT